MPAPTITVPDKTPEEILADKTASDAAVAQLEAAKKVPEDVVKEWLSDTVSIPVKKEDKPEETKKPSEAAPKQDEKPKPVAKKSVKKSAAPAPVRLEAPEPDYEKIAEASARGVTEALKAKPAESQEQPPADQSFLDDSDRRKLPMLKKMEEMFPDRYKGLEKKYVENAKAVAEYQSKWEAEHPDDAFDPQAEEHNDFYAKHNVEWDDDDAVDARAELVAERKLGKVNQKTEEELRLLKLKERQEEFDKDPVNVQEAITIDRKVFELAGGDFPKILKPDGTVDAEVMQKIQEENPVAAEIILPEVMNIRRHCNEILKLEKGIVDFNPQNPMHKFLSDYASRQEAEILALPKQDQVNGEGKKFAKAEDFEKMSDKQKAGHYRLTARDINMLMAIEFGTRAAKRVQSEIKRLETLALKMGYSKGNPAPAKTPAAPPQAKPEPEEEIESPTTTGAALPTPSARESAKPQQNGASAFFGKDW